MKSEFWKNAECDRIDRESQGGDVLRGLPRRDFPWTVASEDFEDAEGDAWKCVVLCHDVQPGRTPQTVKVRVELKASCVL